MMMMLMMMMMMLMMMVMMMMMMLYDAACAALYCMPRCARSGPLLRDACGLDSVSEDQGQDAFPLAHDMGTSAKVPC